MIKLSSNHYKKSSEICRNYLTTPHIHPATSSEDSDLHVETHYPTSSCLNFNIRSQLKIIGWNLKTKYFAPVNKLQWKPLSELSSFEAKTLLLQLIFES